jgi:DNA-binding PadR family transcriptional regulator
MNSVDSWLPLSPAVLHILLSLAGEDRHGYAIMTEVARQSAGRCKIGPGTLYDNLDKLLNQGLVEEQQRRLENDDPRRKYYRLTRLGRSVLRAETDRLDGVVKAARARLAPAKSNG